MLEPWQAILIGYFCGAAVVIFAIWVYKRLQ